MGSFSLIHEGMTSSLVYKLDEEEQIDVMTKQMICTNRTSPVLLQLSIVRATTIGCFTFP